MIKHHGKTEDLMIIPGIHLKQAGVDALPDIMSLFKDQLRRNPNEALIADALQNYPSIVAYAGDSKEGTIVGFAYCGYMAPDLLELMNITVHADYRSTGVGSLMLRTLEDQLRKDYTAIMLTNSILYSDDGSKKPVTDFYLRNDYQLVATTGETNMFWKLL